MKFLPLTLAGCAALLGFAAPAQAGWQSVFQTCSFGHSTPVVSGYTPDPCCPQPCCPQQVCTTRYVQRCYYQAVTCYQTRTYYEPCTTYRTSYYYEPVTCYRYTCCYDPCTCSYRQVATPYTSYRLRSQCCPVTSWVQRCCQVPVTTYKQCFYWEPQTCCSLVDPCAQACPANGTSAAPAVAAPAVSESVAPQQPVPAVQEFRNGGTGSPLYDQRYGQPAVPAPMPEGSGSSFRSKSQRPATPPAAAPAPPIVPKLDRIAFDAKPSTNQANLVGQVLNGDSSNPKAGAKLMFVSETQKGTQATATADPTGKFQVTLAPGGWRVYFQDDQGKPVYHSKLSLKKDEVQKMTLVSR